MLIDDCSGVVWDVSDCVGVSEGELSSVMP